MQGSRLRLNSKEERAEILIQFTKRLIVTECADMEILTHVDRLCRRSWPDLHTGWIAWSFYMEKLIGQEKYQEWAKNNCYSITSELNQK